MAVQMHSIAPAAQTTAGNTGALANLGSSDLETLVVEINCTAVSGTSPSLTPTVEASVDGTTWYTLTMTPAPTAITAVSKQRLVAQNVVEPFVRVSWPAPTGTTPSLTIGFNFIFE